MHLRLMSYKTNISFRDLSKFLADNMQGKEILNPASAVLVYDNYIYYDTFLYNDTFLKKS